MVSSKCFKNVLETSCLSKCFENTFTNVSSKCLTDHVLWEHKNRDNNKLTSGVDFSVAVFSSWKV